VIIMRLFLNLDGNGIKQYLPVKSNDNVTERDLLTSN
jgi:hypothetical protein